MGDRTERMDGIVKNGADEISAAVAEDLASFDVLAAEAESETALARGTELPDLPSGGLLSFYDTLRERVLETIERRAGKLPGDAARMLLLVPDVFILLVRLTLDKSVPRATRAMIGGALAYFILPFDLLPEAILGPLGYMDDLVLAAAVLSQAFGGELEPYARKHWSGDEDLRVVLKDVTETAHKLLGHKLYERLKRLLGRRGIELGE
jgi:uncharacterized membrane protein YkvA (DUF1232 family)